MTPDEIVKAAREKELCECLRWLNCRMDEYDDKEAYQYDYKMAYIAWDFMRTRMLNLPYADLIESLQAQLAELRNDYDIADAANTALHGALEYYRRRADAAVEDIHTVYSDGLCEVCGRRNTCLMTLDRGEDGTVCHGIGFEWRGPQEAGKGAAE